MTEHPLVTLNPAAYHSLVSATPAVASMDADAQEFGWLVDAFGPPVA